MGLFDTIDNLFSTAVGDVSSIFSGNISTGGSYLGGLDTGVQPFPVMYQPTSIYGVPQNYGGDSGMITYAEPGPPMAMPVSRSLVPKVPQAIVQRFPALAKWLFDHGLGGGAIRQLLSMLRRWGPTALMGIMGLQAVSELVTYTATKKRRRMNVANTKALRRGLRRLKGFERLSHRVSAQLGRAARSGRSTRRSRCMTCRKSPCMC